MLSCAEAYRRAETARWGESPVCVHCGARRAHLLTVSRPGRRRVWTCAACRRQFSVLTGTVWHGTHLELPVWVSVVAYCASTGAVPTIAEVRTAWGLSAEAARHVRRLLLAALPVDMPPGSRTDELLAALLRLDPASAESIRRASTRRARPLRQVGPSREFGAV